MRLKKPDCPLCHSNKYVEVSSNGSSGSSGPDKNGNIEGSDSTYWKCNKCIAVFHINITYFTLKNFPKRVIDPSITGSSG